MMSSPRTPIAHDCCLPLRLRSRAHRWCCICLALAGIAGGCATLGSLGPKYEPDEVDALNAKTKQIAAKLVRTADDLKRIQEVLMRVADGDANAVNAAKQTVDEIKQTAAELAKIPDDVKQIIASAESLLRNAPKNYAGPRALHLPKKKELLEEAVETVKGMPKQIQEIGLAAQELGNCAATLVSGGKCDPTALANAKVTVPPALRALASKARPTTPDSSATTASTTAGRRPMASGTVTFTCPQAEVVAEKMYAALGSQCQILLAERQLRADLERGAGVCNVAPLQAARRFAFSWTSPEEPQMAACIARSTEFWTKMRDQADNLQPSCDVTDLVTNVARHVAKLSQPDCDKVAARMLDEFRTFRAASGFVASPWGSTPKEAFMTLANLRDEASGDFSQDRVVAGFDAHLVFRFELERLTRVEVSFKRDAHANSSLPSPAQLERVLTRKYGKPALASTEKATKTAEALGEMGLAYLCPLEVDDSAVLWVLPETVIVLHWRVGNPPTLVYASRQLAAWAADVDDAARAKTI